MNSPLVPFALDGVKEKIMQAESRFSESAADKEEIDKIKAEMIASKAKFASITAQLSAEPDDELTRDLSSIRGSERELKITQSMLENSKETIKLLQLKIAAMETAAKSDQAARSKEATLLREAAGLLSSVEQDRSILEKKLRESAANAARQVSSLVDEIRDKESQIQDLISQVSSLKKEKDVLVAAAVVSDAALAHIDYDHDLPKEMQGKNLADLVLDFRRSFGVLQEESSQFRSDFQDVVEQNARLSAELDSVRLNAKDVESRLTSAIQDNNLLQATVDRLQGKITSDLLASNSTETRIPVPPAFPTTVATDSFPSQFSSSTPNRGSKSAVPLTPIESRVHFLEAENSRLADALSSAMSDLQDQLQESQSALLQTSVATSEMEQLVKEKDHVCEQLEQAVSNLHEQLVDATTALADLKNKNQYLEEALFGSQQSVEDLSGELAQIQAAEKESQALNEALVSELSAVKEELTATKSMLGRESNLTNDLRAEVNDLNSTLKNAKEEMRAKELDYCIQIHKSQQEIDRLNGQAQIALAASARDQAAVDRLKAKVEELVDEATQNKESFRDAEEELLIQAETAQNMMAVKSAELESAKATIDFERGKKLEYQQMASEIARANNVLRTELLEKNTKINVLEQDLADAQHAVDELLNRAAEMDRELTLANQIIEEQANGIRSLQAEKKALEKCLNRIDSQLGVFHKFVESNDVVSSQIVPSLLAETSTRNTNYSSPASEALILSATPASSRSRYNSQSKTLSAAPAVMPLSTPQANVSDDLLLKVESMRTSVLHMRQELRESRIELGKVAAERDQLLEALAKCNVDSSPSVAVVARLSGDLVSSIQSPVKLTSAKGGSVPSTSKRSRSPQSGTLTTSSKSLSPLPLEDLTTVALTDTQKLIGKREGLSRRLEDLSDELLQVRTDLLCLESSNTGDLLSSQYCGSGGLSLTDEISLEGTLAGSEMFATPMVTSTPVVGSAFTKEQTTPGPQFLSPDKVLIRSNLAVRDKVDSIVLEVASIKKSIAEMHSIHHEVGSTNDSLVVENDQLKREIDGVNERYQRALDDLEQSSLAQQSALTEAALLRDTRAALVQQIGSVEAEKRVLREQIAKSKEENEHLSKAMAHLHSTLHASEMTKNHFNQLLGNANNDIEGLRNTVEQLEFDADAYAEEIEQLEADLISLQAQVSNLTNEKDSMSDQNSRLKAEVGELHVRIDELEKDADAWIAEIEELEQNKADLINQVTSSKALSDAAEPTIVQLRIEAENYRNDLEAAVAERSNLQSIKLNLELELRESKDELVSLKAHVSELEADHEAWADEVEELEVERANLKEDITSLTTELATLKDIQIQQNTLIDDLKQRGVAQAAEIDDLLAQKLQLIETQVKLEDKVLQLDALNRSVAESLEESNRKLKSSLLEISALESKIQKSDEATLDLFCRLDQLAIDKRHAGEVLEKLQADKSALSAQLQGYQDELSALTTSKSEVEKEVSVAREEQAVLLQRMNFVDGERSAAQLAQSNAESELAALLDELSRRQSEFEIARNAIEGEKDRLEETIRILEANLATVNMNLRQSEDQIICYTSEIEGNQTRLSDMSTSAAEQIRVIDSLELKIEGLEAANDDLKSSITNLNADISELKANIVSTARELAFVEDQKRLAGNLIATLREEKSDLLTRIAILDADVNAKDELLSSQSETISSLVTEKKLVDEALVSLSAVLSESEREKLELQASLSREVDENSRCQSVITKLQKCIAENEVMLADTKRSHEEVTSNHAGALQLVAESNNQISILESRCQICDQEIAGLREKNGVLLDSIEQLNCSKRDAAELLQKLQADKSALSAQLQGYQDELSALTTSKSEVEKEVSVAREEQAVLLQRMNFVDGERSAAQLAQSNAESELAALQDELSRRQSEFEIARNAIEGEKNRLEETIRIFESQLVDVQGKNLELSAATSTAIADLTSCLSEKQNLSATCESLASDLSSLTINYSSLEIKNDQLEKLNAANIEIIQATADEKTDLYTRLITAEEQLQAVQATNDELKLQVFDLKTSTESLQTSFTQASVDIELLKEEKSKLNLQLEEVLGNIDIWEQEVEKLDEVNLILAKRVDEADNSIDEFKQQVHELNQQKVSLAERVHQLVSDCESWERENNEIQAQLDSVCVEKERIQAENHGLNEQVQSLTSENSALLAKLDDLQEAVENQVESLQNDIQTWADTVDSLEEEKGQMVKMLAEAQANSVASARNKEAAETAVADALTKANEAALRSNVLESENCSLAKQVATLEALINSLKLQEKDSTSARRAIEAERDTLRSRLAVLEETIVKGATNEEAFAAERDLLSAQISDLSSQLEAAHGEVAELTEDIDELHNEKNALIQRMVDLENVAHELRENTSSTNRECASLREQISVLSTRASKAEADSSRWEESKNIAEEALEAMASASKKEKQSLSAKVSSLSAENEELVGEIAVLKEEIRVANEEIATLNEDLSDLISKQHELQKADEELRITKVDLAFQMEKNDDLTASLASLAAAKSVCDNEIEILTAKLSDDSRTSAEIAVLEDKLRKKSEEVENLQALLDGKIEQLDKVRSAGEKAKLRIDELETQHVADVGVGEQRALELAALKADNDAIDNENQRLVLNASELQARIWLLETDLKSTNEELAQLKLTYCRTASDLATAIVEKNSAQERVQLLESQLLATQTELAELVQPTAENSIARETAPAIVVNDSESQTSATILLEDSEEVSPNGDLVEASKEIYARLIAVEKEKAEIEAELENLKQGYAQHLPTSEMLSVADELHPSSLPLSNSQFISIVGKVIDDASTAMIEQLNDFWGPEEDARRVIDASKIDSEEYLTAELFATIQVDELEQIEKLRKKFLTTLDQLQELCEDHREQLELHLDNQLKLQQQIASEGQTSVEGKVKELEDAIATLKCDKAVVETELEVLKQQEAMRAVLATTLSAATDSSATINSPEIDLENASLVEQLIACKTNHANSNHELAIARKEIHELSKALENLRAARREAKAAAKAGGGSSSGDPQKTSYSPLHPRDSRADSIADRLETGLQQGGKQAKKFLDTTVAKLFQVGNAFKQSNPDRKASDGISGEAARRRTIAPGEQPRSSKSSSGRVNA